ncbi:hypothetical protein [Caballeronia arationis]|uniref:hypothetical protein n=1 Tax=Caballeronia arationis TaxID=1777142 RepID=UPI000BE46BE6|nr:hypothetical protein [Caballeronia arationis]
MWLATQLRGARVAFEVLCGTWPEVFMTEADKALAHLGLPRLGPVEPPSASQHEAGGDTLAILHPVVPRKSSLRISANVITDSGLT